MKRTSFSFDISGSILPGFGGASSIDAGGSATGVVVSTPFSPFQTLLSTFLGVTLVPAILELKENNQSEARMASQKSHSVSTGYHAFSKFEHKSKLFIYCTLFKNVLEMVWIC